MLGMTRYLPEYIRTYHADPTVMKITPGAENRKKSCELYGESLRRFEGRDEGLDHTAPRLVESGAFHGPRTNFRPLKGIIQSLYQLPRTAGV